MMYVSQCINSVDSTITPCDDDGIRVLFGGIFVYWVAHISELIDRRVILRSNIPWNKHMVFKV